MSLLYSRALKETPEVLAKPWVDKNVLLWAFGVFYGAGDAHFHDHLEIRKLQAEQLGYECAWFSSVT